MSKQKELAPLVETIIYELKGITYVPNFRNKHLYVSPGYGRYHTRLNAPEELEKAGAKKLTSMMWQRGEFGVEL